MRPNQTFLMVALGFAGLAPLGVGCAAGSDGDATAASSSSTTAGSGGAGTGGASSSSTGTGGGLSVGSGGSSSSSGGPEVSVVYGHSSDTLYELDPVSNSVTVVGMFPALCEDVLDLAVDKDGNIYATTFDGLFTVNGDNATCALVSNGTYPNSLSFVPEGTVDANSEALVGYQDDDYVRVDVTTGAVTTIAAGTLTGGLISSGDIVSVIGGGTYLTVKGGGCDDCLVEVNPSTGAVVKDFGDVGHSQVFGLAYWGGSAYGFSNSGELFEITFNGNSVSTSLISIPNAPMDLKFWGAGSSTSAPLVPPS